MGDWMFIVASGAIAVIKKADDGAPVRVATLRKGEFGGMMGLFEAMPRSATLRVCEPLTLWVLDHATWARRVDAILDGVRELPRNRGGAAEAAR